MESFIKLTRHPYEEPHHLRLFLESSNGRIYGNIEIYANASDLITLSRELRGFPKRQEDEARWKLGSERAEDRFAFYFRLRVKQVTSTGQCAVELRFNNNETFPYREIVEFSIPALPADIDRLANLLKEFGKLQHRVLLWNVTDGELRKDA
jgi:hypothetical protein